MVQPWDYFHAPGASGLTVESYLSRTENGTGNPLDSPNVLYAQPWFTGDLALNVASFGIRVTTTGLANVDLAVYEATSERDVYPSNRIWQSATPINYGVLGPVLRSVAQSFTAGKLYWLVTNTDGGTGSHARAYTSFALNYPAGVLGWIPASGAGANMLSVARNFALGMPTTFPAGAVPVRGNNPTPSSAAPAIVVVPQP